MDRLRFALAGLIVLFAGAVLAMMLNPQVSRAYRAYFIDRSTDCWRLPVKGTMAMDETISLVGRQADGPTFALRHCGWMEPQETGTWSTGPEASLRLDPGLRDGDLVLDLEMLGYLPKEQPSQRVWINLAGRVLAELVLEADTPPHHSIVLPAESIGPSGPIDLGFYFPDATALTSAGSSGISNHLAVRILSLRLSPAVSP